MKIYNLRYFIILVILVLNSCSRNTSNIQNTISKLKQQLIESLKQDFTLETNNLILRKVSMQDFDDIFEIFGDKEVHAFLTYPPKTQEETKKFIESVLEGYKEGFFVLAIELPSEQKVIGILSLNINFDNDWADFGLILNKKYWGKGYAVESINKIFEFVFKDLNLNRAQAMCMTNNTSMQRVFKKLNMQYEGTLRKYRRDSKTPSSFVDAQIWAILKDDFLSTTPD